MTEDISSLDPSSSVPGPENIDPSSSSAPPSSNIPIMDTLSSGGPSAPAISNVNHIPSLPILPIVDFSHIILSNQNNVSIQLFHDQQANPHLYDNLFKSCILTLEGLIAARNAINDEVRGLVDVYQNENENVSTVNHAIHDFNLRVGTEDQTQTTTMNNAIDAFNTATDTYNTAIATYSPSSPEYAQAGIDYLAAIDTYNAAVDAYNNYNSQRDTDTINTQISNFNIRVISNNNTIDILNQYAPTYGQQPLSHDNTISIVVGPLPSAESVPPATTPIASIPTPLSVPTTFNAITPVPTNPAKMFIDAFQPLFKAFQTSLTQVKSLGKKYRDMADYEAFVRYFFKGKIPILPAAYVTPHPKATMSSGGGSMGAGSGVSLAGLIASLSNPLVNAIISQSASAAELAKLSNPLSPSVVDELQLFNIQFLKQVGLYSALLAAGVISKVPPDEKSPTVNASLGLSFAQQVSVAVSSKGFDESILALLKNAYPKASESALKDLADKLTAASKIFLIQVALSLVAQTIGKPDLLAQTLATLTNAGGTLTSAGNLSKTSIGATLGEVLHNIVSIGFLKDSLVNQLIANGVVTSQNKAQNLVENVVNQVLSNNDITTKKQLKEALISALTQYGVTIQVATNLANHAVAFVHAEAQAGYLLDTGVATSDLNQENLAQAIAKEVQKAYENASSTVQGDIQTENLQAGITSEEKLSADIQAQSTAAGILTQEGLTKQNLSVSILRDAIIKAGVSQENLNASILKSVIEQSGLNRDNLNASILQDAIAQAGITQQNISTSILNDAIAQADINRHSLTQDGVNASNANAQSFADALNAANNSASILAAQQSSDNQTAEANAYTVSQDQINQEATQQDVINAQSLQAEIIAKSILSSFITKEYISQREFRDRIAKELEGKNVPNEQAVLIATNVVVGAGVVIPTFSFETLPVGALASAISSHVASRLTPEVGEKQAQKIADKIAEAILGSQVSNILANEETESQTNFKNNLSLRHHLETQVQILTNKQDNNFADAVDDNFRAALKPTLDLYTFNQQLMDPAFNILKSMHTGIMYQHAEPSNFQKTIDMPV